MENHRLVSDKIRQFFFLFETTTIQRHFMLILLPQFTVSRTYVCTERVNISSIFLFHIDISCVKKKKCDLLFLQVSIKTR